MSARRTNCSPCAALGLAACLPLLALALADSGVVGWPPPWADARDCVGEAVVEAVDEGERALESDPLRGLWMRYETRGEGDPLRFWYFHGDGKGLYRYGKVGLANTHSFDYAITEAREPGRVDVELRFRKRGEAHSLAAVIERDARGRSFMTLHGDPREPGARYRKVESELDLAALADAPTAEGARAIGERIWIDYRTHATGGAEFHMYQLAKTAIDGRGVGWFHRGDFDDWSTESLTYRIDGERLELFFDIREEPNVTKFHIVDGERGRELILDEDPRDYWATHRYRDGGRSFAEGVVGLDGLVGVQRGLARLAPHRRR